MNSKRILLFDSVTIDMRPMNLRNENLLIWNNFRNGDPDAYTSLIRIHYQDLFNYATRFTKDTYLVKDCLQELFLWLWKSRLTINETVFIKYYLLKALRHLLINAKLTSSNFNFYNSSYAFETFPETGIPIESIIIQNEETAALTAKMKIVLSRLSKREQEVIYLRFYVDADIDEISDIMSLNRQSTYNLMHEALKKLRKIVPSRSVLFTDFSSFVTAAIVFENIFSRTQ